MYRHMAADQTHGGQPTDNGDAVVTLNQIPRWSDGDFRYSYEIEDLNFPNSHFPDPLASSSGTDISGKVSRFPVDHELNSKIYLWRGNPWNLEVDAVVNSTNENLDETQCSPGLHAAAGPGLAEECATLGGCRTGMAKVTNAYDLPARRVIHTVRPKYAVKYHTATENALSHCYHSCLELLIENGLQIIAMGCIYTEAKNYPREPAAHVAIRTVCRLLEKQKDKITGVTTTNDTEIYKRDHWVLAVLDMQIGSCYYLDSVGHGNVDRDLKRIIEVALSIYARKSGSNQTFLRWINVKCPIQPGITECGYYVLKLMKAIVDEGLEVLTNNFWGKVTCTNAELDMVREEWCSYVTNFVY